MENGEHSPDLTKFLEREARSPNQGVEYVASPYWHPRREVRQARTQAALAGTTMLIEKRVAALSPVVYSATIQEQAGFSPPEGWYGFDLHLLAASSRLTVLEIPGWEESRGVLIELGFARGRGMPVRWVPWPEIQERLDPETVRVVESWKDGS